MTFSLHQGGVVISSQITLTQSSNTHPLANIPGTCALIFGIVAPPFTVYPDRIMLLLLLLKPAAQAQVGKTKLFINCLRNHTGTCITEN